MQREGLDTRMSKIAIVTDSNSGITQAEGARRGIHVLPMPFMIDEVTYYEDIDLTQEQFYEKLKSGANIATSQPSPDSVTSLWDKLLQEYDEIVHIPMSSGLSGSCQSAMAFAADYDGRVQVVNNQRISVTQRQSALDALQLAAAGKNAAQIKEFLENDKFNSSIYIMLDTLYYLKKGGRITPAAAAIGTMLRLKPVLTIQGDKLDAYTKTRGMKSAFKAMCKALDKDLSGRLSALHTQGLLKAGIAYTQMDPDTLEFFKEEMKKRYPDLELFQLPLTMSIGCHTGPGALGIGLVRVHK